MWVRSYCVRLTGILSFYVNAIMLDRVNGKVSYNMLNCQFVQYKIQISLYQLHAVCSVIYIHRTQFEIFLNSLSSMFQDNMYIVGPDEFFRRTLHIKIYLHFSLYIFSKLTLLIMFLIDFSEGHKNSQVLNFFLRKFFVSSFVLTLSRII